MTEILVDDGAGSRVHAFVVGVAHYPYIGKGLGAGAARRLLDDLDQVSVPEPSAREIAEWLLSTARQPGDPPIGTVEVLISAPGPEPAKVRLQDGTAVEVESAVLANFRAGFRRWRTRCGSNRDHTAIFYFCGHGWRHGDQLLLLEDLGKDPDLLLENAVDLGEIRARMHLTGPRLQAYFIDACREVPPDLPLTGSRPSQLADTPDPDGPLEPIEAPVFFSTAVGHTAFGDDGAVTPYTAGVLAALQGQGARRNHSGWAVTTGSLAERLHAILDWDRTGDAVQDVRIEGQLSGRAVLHSLPGAPVVPFRIDCRPANAPLPERVTVYPLISPAYASPPQIFEAACGRLAAGIYEIHPGYPTGSGLSGEVCYHAVDTPNAVLPVTIRLGVPERS